MASSATLSDRAPNVLKEWDTTFRATKTASSLRTASFSSSSSSSLSSCSSLYILDDSPLSTATPLRFSGVPFSWEHLPGIPKKQSYKKKDSSSLKELPLPPPAASTSISKRFNSGEIGIRKKNSNDSFRRDPFFAALVQCSKDDDDDEQDLSNNNFWGGPKVSRRTSDRFGFINLYTSCKKTCAVSESIVYLPRSSRTSYDRISRRSRWICTIIISWNLCSFSHKIKYLIYICLVLLSWLCMWGQVLSQKPKVIILYVNITSKNEGASTSLLCLMNELQCLNLCSVCYLTKILYYT